MPRYIVKLRDDKTKIDYYLEWSTVVDAPVTYGMSLEEFKDYYVQQYGVSSTKELQDRLERVEEKGVSGIFADSADDFIKYNRAGENEKTISKKKIIERYCTKVTA